MVQDEVQIVNERLNAHLALQTGLIQMVISATPNMSVDAKFTKRAANLLTKTLKGLRGDGG